MSTPEAEKDSAIVIRFRNDFIFNAQKTAIFGSSLTVTSFAFLVYSYVSTAKLIIWSIFCLGAYVYRYIIYSLYNAADEQSQGKPYWIHLFSSATMLSGSIWGASVFLVFPENSQSYQMMLLLILALLSAASAVAHAGHNIAASLFCVSALLPASIRLLTIEQDGYREMGYFMLFFMVVLIILSRTLVKIADKLFSLTYENNKLLSDFKKSNSDLIRKNNELESAKHELRVANDSLQQLATTDVLTNLTNRRKFETIVKIKWQRSAEAKTPMALLIIDIDSFKQYNDFYGDRKGDSCLVKIADSLASSSEVNKEHDCVARYSGDSFAMLLMNSDLACAKAVAQSVLKQVELLRISRADIPHEYCPWVTVSIGIAVESDYYDVESDHLIESAVKNVMMAKKRSGGNCIEEV